MSSSGAPFATPLKPNAQGRGSQGGGSNSAGPYDEAKFEQKTGKQAIMDQVHNGPRFHYDDNIPLYNYGRAAAIKFSKLGVDPAKDFRALRAMYPSFRSLRQALMQKELFLSKHSKEVFKQLYDQSEHILGSQNQPENPTFVAQDDSPEDDTIKYITQNTTSNLSVAPEFFQRPQQKSLTSNVASQLINAELQTINGPQTSTVIPHDMRVAARGLPVFTPDEVTGEANRVDDTLHINNVTPVSEINLDSDQAIGIAVQNAEDHPTILDPESGIRHEKRFKTVPMQPMHASMTSSNEPVSENTDVKNQEEFWTEYLPMKEKEYEISKIAHNREEEINKRYWMQLNDKNHRIDFKNQMEINHMAQKAALFYNVELTSPLPPNFRGAEMSDGAKIYGSYLAEPFKIAQNQIDEEANLIRKVLQDQMDPKGWVGEEWARKNINAARSAITPHHIGTQSYIPGRWIVGYPPPFNKVSKL